MGSRIETNLCKDCSFRFRRVFYPRNPEDYEFLSTEIFNTSDEDGNNNDPIFVINICLISSTEIDGPTIECSHYVSNDEDDTEVDAVEALLPFFSKFLKD